MGGWLRQADAREQLQPQGAWGQQDDLVALSQARNFEELLLITQKGTTVRISVAAVSEQGRTATGVQLQRLDPDDVVASVAIVPRLDDNEATDEEPTAET